MLQCFRREMHDFHPQTCDCNSRRLIDAATEKQAECSLFSQRDCKAALGILLSQQQGRLTFVGCTLARSCRSTHRLSHCLASCRLSPLGSGESSEVETPPPKVARGITLGRPTSSPPSWASPTPRLLSATSTVRPPPTPRPVVSHSLFFPREAPDSHHCHVFQSNFPRCQSQTSPQQS